jgi:hypothetical protein
MVRGQFPGLREGQNAPAWHRFNDPASDQVQEVFAVTEAPWTSLFPLILRQGTVSNMTAGTPSATILLPATLRFRFVLLDRFVNMGKGVGIRVFAALSTH